MKDDEFVNIDDHWFEEICSNLDINQDSIKEGPTGVRNTLLSRRSDRFDLDMSHTTGSSLFDLLNLFLFIDYAQATKAPVYIKMPFSDFAGDEFDRCIYTISQFNELNKGANCQALNPKELVKLRRSKYIYRFLSFCHYFGFFDALQSLRSAGQLYFDQCTIDDLFLSQLFQYRGAKSFGSKVFGLLPIYKLADIYNFRDGSIIENWTKSLSPEIQKFPIFKDGEFARVFGYQLVKNIGEHSGEDYSGDYGALGAIAMRILPPNIKEAKWLTTSFPETMQNVFLRPDNSNGVLEICVGDRGAGIVTTLKKTLETYHCRFGIDQEISDIDVISFAFDELGTAKPLDKRLGGVHALHRILKCVTKYQGVMRVRTHGKELIYDPTIKEGAYRGKTNFGIYSEFSKETLHPFGVQIQILIPLTAPTINKSVKLSRREKYTIKSIEPFSIRVVPLITYVEKNDHDIVLLSLLVDLSNSLMEEPATKTIVFDFSGSDWIEDDIALILTQLKRVLHTHKCIGVNLDSGIARLLRDRELNETLSDFRGVEGLRSFFDVLSSKHRLLPVLDNSQKIWWFGLGNYQLDKILTDLFIVEDSLTQKEMEESLQESLNDLNEIMKIYHGANNDFLAYGNMYKLGWSCKISMADFDYALSVVIHTKFEKIIEKYKCIKREGFYKLPARNDFSRAFFQSTALLQDNILSRQIGDWAAFAIRRKFVDRSEKELLLVCATAPAELFAKIISDSLPNFICHIINLGHYSSLDRERYLETGGWDSPALIVADVIDSIRTVKHIADKLRANDITIEGLISMVMFFEDESIDKYPEFCWNEIKFDEKSLDIFFLYKMVRPEIVKENEIFNQTNSSFIDEKLFFVEPFSLEIFKYTALSQSRPSNAPKSQVNQKRIEAIERIGAIRAGHWVYGSHHFLVTTCIINMLRDDNIGGEICHEIVQICINKQIDHILLPLHSQISFILPRVISSLKLSASIDVDFTFCLSTRVITEQNFYVLPNKIKELIGVCSSRDSGLRLLIIDDAVASGRTLETMLRSLVLTSRKHSGGGRSPVEYVHAYSILDRQGRARGTSLTGINKFKLYGDGEWLPETTDSYEFEFHYERWVDVDMPVKKKETCPFCSERDDLLSLIEMLSNLPEKHSILTLIKNRIKELAPSFLDSPKFLKEKERKLPWPVQVGQHKAETIELVLWEFYNLLHRGCPILYFISWLDQFDSLKEQDKEYEKLELDNLYELKLEIIRQLFRNWERLTSQWAGYQFKQYLLKEFEKDTNIPVLILAEAGAALGKATAAKKILKDLFLIGLGRLLLTERDDDSSLEIRSRFALGCKLFCINYLFYNTISKYKHGSSNEGYVDIQEEIEKIDPNHGKTSYSKLEVQEIIRLSKNMYHEIDFISEFKEVLIQTVRPGRHRHSHLLISRLLKIANGGVILNSERRLVRDRILNFLHTFKITLEIFPRLIPSTELSIYEEFREDLDCFQKKLGNSWVNDIPPASIQCLASEITNHFPYQDKNRVYQALCKTQVSIHSIFNYIKAGCVKRGYGVICEIPTELDDLYIMAPNEHDLLEGIIKNYTYDAGIDRDYCSNPLLHVITKKNEENRNIILLEIYSNFQPYSKVNISTGPGRIELSNHDYSIFGIAMTDECAVDEISGIKYQIKISIQFYKGLKVK